MDALDSVLRDVGNQFGISTGSSTSLLSGLLSTITRQEGGLSGLLDRFRLAGVGNIVSSWFSGETQSACIRGQSWGNDGQGIWVDRPGRYAFGATPTENTTYSELAISQLARML